MTHPDEAEFTKKVDDLLDPIYGPRHIPIQERIKNLIFEYQGHPKTMSTVDVIVDLKKLLE